MSETHTMLAQIAAGLGGSNSMSTAAIMHIQCIHKARQVAACHLSCYAPHWNSRRSGPILKDMAGMLFDANVDHGMVQSG